MRETLIMCELFLRTPNLERSGYLIKLNSLQNYWQYRKPEHHPQRNIDSQYLGRFTNISEN